MYIYTYIYTYIYIYTCICILGMFAHAQITGASNHSIEIHQFVSAHKTDRIIFVRKALQSATHTNTHAFMHVHVR